jgi:hypothetical protein
MTELPIQSSSGRTVMELNQFADRYVALWNEPDPTKRRVQIATLWVERSNRRG